MFMGRHLEGCAIDRPVKFGCQLGGIEVLLSICEVGGGVEEASSNFRGPLSARRGTRRNCLKLWTLHFFSSLSILTPLGRMWLISVYHWKICFPDKIIAGFLQEPVCPTPRSGKFMVSPTFRYIAKQSATYISRN